MCTSITLKTKDNKIITGRTNEFEAKYANDLVFKPRGFVNEIISFENKKNVWTNKYSFIFLNSKGLISNIEMANDGMNEKGLSASLLYFHYHEYRELSYDEVKEDNLNILLLTSYLLGNYSNVNEIKKDIKNLTEKFYWPKNFSQKGLGQHIIIVDKSGESIVIEPEKKELVIKDNPLGSLTNSFPLEFHHNKLNEYSHLSSEEQKVRIKYRNLEDKKLLTVGNGLFGIPGDFTADSRFVRASIFSSIIDTPSNANEGVRYLFRILNNFDIVPGYITEKISDKEMTEFKKKFPLALTMSNDKNTLTSHTDNTIVKDLTNLKIYYKTHNNISHRFVDFGSMINNKEELKISIDEDKTIEFQKIKLKK